MIARALAVVVTATALSATAFAAPEGDQPAADQKAADQKATDQQPAGQQPAGQPADQAANQQPGTSPQGADQKPDHQKMLADFNARIAELEGKIALAKEKVDSLRDTILSGSIARARTILVHKNDMGGSFVLERATYILDGGVIYDRENTDGALDRNKAFEIFNGPMNPGDHTIEVLLTYAGSAEGFFAYLKGYKFKVASRQPYHFNVADGRTTTLSIVSFPKGDITQNTSDRIGLRYDAEVDELPPIVQEQEQAKPKKKL